MKYSTDDGINWVEREEHSFRTQRSPGSNFSFTIISDSHAMYNTQYQNAITNIKNENPDFHLDLGDTYMVDNANSQTTVNNAYLAQREPLYMDGIGHSFQSFLHQETTRMKRVGISMTLLVLPLPVLKPGNYIIQLLFQTTLLRE